MSRKFKVDIRTGAFATVFVEIADEQLTRVAADLGVEIDELTVADLMDVIIESYTNPGICARCSGWGDDKVSLSLGDDWDLDVGEGQNETGAVEEVTK